MNDSQYVVFAIGNEEYGIEITCAQEIIRIPEKITKMPNMPVYIEGMVNLRGRVIPVIDLKKRFGFQSAERGMDSRLLILNLGDSMVGTIVDDVSEVIKVDENSIQKMNADILGFISSSIKGIAQVDERLIVLLDAKKIKTEILQNN